MPQELSAEVEQLFNELIELESAAREVRLGEAGCSREVSTEVASLLAADERAGDFLGLRASSTERGQTYREPGSLVATRYQLERRLGGGAMGDVYLAWDRQLERQVALKFLRMSAEVDPTGHSRLLAEARAAARLDHPHVATVHDIGETEHRRLFIAMAYYPGETLRDRIARGPLPPSDALRIAAQIAAALAAAHSAGIIHRDVKPANVLFDAEGVVKLADFGVAKLLSDREATSPGIAVGTMAYMSPEQARGESVDSRTDLWALGVVLYEMLAGHRPFVAEPPVALLHALLSDEPIPLPDGDVPLSSAVRSLVAALLEKNPAQRANNAAAVCDTLSQLGAGDEVLIAAPPAVRLGALPNAVTSFIGREREIEIARNLLRSTRLLTLTGPGGTGKTRLAIQLATSVREQYPSGVWFVPLAEITDADLVPSLVAQTLGIRDLGGGMASSRVAATLQDRKVLLVLDNFEHVLTANTFVAELLATCAGVSLLVTSRAPLALQGEQELPVPPLRISTHVDADAVESEAVQLFVQRARAVRPDFVITAETRGTVVEICRRLDGLPLALELAAARAKLLSPRAMLSRLEHRLDLLRADAHDRPTRHSTMREVIDWSYVLLTDAERGLFNRLAVFAGGVSVEAAETVATPDHDGSDSTFVVLDVLASLCNKSLLRHDEQPDGEPRFIMLETVREFGLDRLRATGDEASARRAHRAYCLTVAEGAAAQLRGPAQTAWLDRLETEYANCRIALDGALDDALDDALAGTDFGRTDAARLAIALHRLWFTRGPLLEGVEYLRRTIAATDAAGIDTKLRARLLTSAAHLANTRSVFPEARELFSRALDLHREADDRAGMATTLNNLAWTVWIIGDLARGEELSTTAMGMHREAGDELGVTLSLNNLAWIAMERGDYPRAESYFARVVASHRERGDRRTTGFALGWVGALAARRGDYPRAIALQQQAIEMLGPVADRAYRMLCFVRLAAARHASGEPGTYAADIETEYLPALREEGRLWPIAFALTELGAILRDDGELQRARATLMEALEVRRQTGGLQGVAEARLLLGTVYYRDGDYIHASDQFAHALREAQKFGAIPIVIDCIEAIAAFVLDNGRPELGAILLGAAARARNALGAQRAPRYQPEYERLRAAFATVLGEGPVAGKLKEGGILTVDDASSMALEELRA
ncbi:MAG: protein kinase [Gemmatimonadaceae bacterium]